MPDRPALCRSHPDCHLPPEVDAGTGFDGDAYGRRMRENGADLAIAFAKCHYGHAYYPTRVGTPHPRLRADLLGETVRGLHRHGLGASGYVSVHLDSEAARRRPDWLMQGSAVTTAGFDSGAFQRLCVNSGYGDELFIPQCQEVVRDYEVDELLLDTMPGFSPCHCHACRAAFGRAIPAGAQEDGWLAYARWYAGCFDRFYERATAAIRRVRDLPVLWNHKWTYAEPELPSVPGTRVVTDRIASPGWASIDARYGGGTGLPVDYMCGRFAHGLGEWNSNTRESLALTAATACANGATFWLIDRQLTDGSLEERAWRAMGETFAEVQARRPWLVGARPVEETAVLCSIDHLLGPDRRHFPDAPARARRARPIEAALGFLAEHGRLGLGMPRERLLERLDALRLVVLPDVSYLDDGIVEALMPWVAAGGRVLASMPADGPTAPLCRLAGVADEGGLGGHAFVDRPGDDPLLIAQAWRRLRPLGGTVVLAGLRLPLLPKYGHGIAPPGPSAGCPALTRRAIGHGSVTLAAGPLFATWWEWASPGLERLLMEAIDALLPEPLARVDHPGQVELAASRLGDDLVLHLVNRCGRTRLGGWYYPMTRFVPELAEVPLRLRAGRALDLRLEPGGAPLPCAARDGVATATVPRLQAWQVVVSRGHFIH
jgi:hypothetical protein